MVFHEKLTFFSFRVSARIGQVAMKHAALQYNMDPSLASMRTKRHAPPPPNPFTGDFTVILCTLIVIYYLI